MKRYLLGLVLCIMLFLPGTIRADTAVIGGGNGVQTDTNCNQANYFPIGVLCQDTDDGKLYKGTGAAVEEITSGTTVATDTIWDAAGDLVQGTGANTAAKLTAGATAGMYLRSGGTGAANVWSTLILPNSGTIYKLAAYTAANTLGELAAVGGTGEILIGNTGALPTWSASPLVATLTAASANSITVGADSASSGPAIGSIIFHNATNTNHFSLISGTTGAALSWTLPIAAPAGNNYLLNAQTTGVLGYTDPATFSVAAGSTSLVTYGPTAAQAVTCTENGSPSTLTITPTTGLAINNINLTVDDAEGCTITMSETGATAGAIAIITNVSAANTATFTEGAGVLELTMGAGVSATLKANQTLTLRYVGSQWLEIGRTWDTQQLADGALGTIYNVADPTKLAAWNLANLGTGIVNTQTPVCTGACIFTNNTVGAGTYKYGLLEVAGTWTGEQTFGDVIVGATNFLKIPYGASPTTDAAGKVAIDQSLDGTGGLRLFSDATHLIAPVINTQCSTFKGLVDTDDFPLWRFPRAITVTSISTYCSGDNVVGTLAECEGTNGVCSGTPTVLKADFTTTADTTLETTSLTNAAIAANNWIRWQTTSHTGTNTFFSVCINYTND